MTDKGNEKSQTSAPRSLGGKILVPYDGTIYSDNAVKVAVEYARLIKGAEVTLLYVVPEVHLPPSHGYGMRLPGIKSTREYLKEVYQKIKSDASDMLSQKKQEFVDAGIGVHIKVTIGGPTEQILATASDEGTDLIIMGSMGRSGIARLKTLGSVSRSISERSPCAVMLVH